MVLTCNVGLLKKTLLPSHSLIRVSKKIGGWTLFLFAPILVSGCSEDIDINGNGTATPVVYCFLNPDDSIQYLRLSKTFTIPVDNPGYRPTVADMTYAEKPKVYISEDPSGYKQSFYKCNLNDGIVKDTGWFPVSGIQIFASAFKVKPVYFL